MPEQIKVAAIVATGAGNRTSGRMGSMISDESAGSDVPVEGVGWRQSMTVLARRGVLVLLHGRDQGSSQHYSQCNQDAGDKVAGVVTMYAQAESSSTRGRIGIGAPVLALASITYRHAMINI